MSHFPADVPLEPHEALAVGVIRLALNDGALEFWCHVANVPTALIVSKAQEELQGLALRLQAHAA